MSDEPQDTPQVVRVAGAQTENRIGDFGANVEQIAAAMAWAEDAGADVLVVPELALTGYPLDDLVAHTGFIVDAEDALNALAARAKRTTTVVSTVRRVPPRRHDDTQQRDRVITAAVLNEGEIRGYYDKVLLPTYSVFDEQRVFTSGTEPARVWRIGDVVFGVAICEDAWSGDGPPEAQAVAGARLLLLPNASPFERGKDARRLALVRQVCRRNGMPTVYVNSYGGADDLVFDGGSLIVDAHGTLVHRSPQFTGDRFLVDLPLPGRRSVTGQEVTVHTRPLTRHKVVVQPTSAPLLDPLEQVWQALVTGTRDFARRNGFTEAVVGLSGGLDSSLTAAVAVDGLGAQAVIAVTAPSGHTADVDLEDARIVAKLLGMRLVEIDLTQITDRLEAASRTGLGDPADDVGGWLSLRIRAAALWAVADERGRLLLATGNKSELSVGAAVPGGDLVGHFAPLSDCPKTLLAQLAEHRNASGEVIPAQVLEKDVTAERARTFPDLDWRIVDEIVERYLERMQGLEDIAAEIADRATVEWVTRQVMHAEFDRRLTPTGVRITGRAFGKDRRVPIAQAWRPHFVRPRAAPPPGGPEPAPAEEGPSD